MYISSFFTHLISLLPFSGNNFHVGYNGGYLEDGTLDFTKPVDAYGQYRINDGGGGYNFVGSIFNTLVIRIPIHLLIRTFIKTTIWVIPSRIFRIIVQIILKRASLR